jgi:adenine specific DNA methylase Mod
MARLPDVKADKAAEQFFDALRDVFVGAKVEGDSGFINLMHIKHDYYTKGVFPHLEADIERALKPFPGFRQELFEKLYSFFSRYFSESGSIYFRHTPGHENVYEKVYTDDRDVVLFWKTHMLYYVKTDRLFKSMEMEVDAYKFRFDATNMPHKQANEKREVIYEFKERTEDGKYVFTVGYSERGRKTRTDDILKALRKLGSEINEETLERAFRVFERQSEVDYFINKDAGKFLCEQFDLWQYQYMFTGGSEWTETRIKQLQALKDVAYKVIDFIAQFEDELVRIWNKPKFVLNSNYVITLDRIAAKDFGLVERLLKHAGMAAQIEEWKQLGIANGGFKKNAIIETDRHDKKLAKQWQHLPIDTKHFKDLELEILGLFDHLDDELDGWLIKSENYQALKTLERKLAGQVKCIYIDPPYNAIATEIQYENNYKHSTWLAFLIDRVTASRSLMSSEGILCITIDDYEYPRMLCALEGHFGADMYLATVPIRNNPSGRSTVKGFAVNHEYAVFWAASPDAIVGRFPHTEEQLARYDQPGADGRRFEMENFRKSSAGSRHADRPKQFFPLYYNPVARTLRIPAMEWQKNSQSWRVLEKQSPDEVTILPLDDNETERVWNWGLPNTRRDIAMLEVDRSGDRWEVYKPKFVRLEGTLPRTWWDKPAYSARDNGTRALVDLFGSERAFEFPKAVEAVKDCLTVGGLTEGKTVLDFVGGSGTTAHAVINLNREDAGRRRYILVEMADYFDTVILPRIKKVVFCEKWNNGKAAGGPGVSHFVKYFQLEQYEQALARAKYEDAGLFEDPNQEPYSQYVFMRDLKMLDASKADAKANKVKVDVSKLFDGIDLAETLSNVTGQKIRRIKPGSVEFEDGEIVDLTDPPFELLKPLIWW